MSIATIEEEIVGVSVRLNQAMRQLFPKIISSCITLNFQSYFKTASSFVGFMWLFTGVSEEKILFPS